MRILKTTMLTAAVITCLVTSASAFAYRGHGHRYGYGYPRASFGVFVGAPYVYGAWNYGPWYYGYAAPYYYSPPVVVQSSPPVYVEQAPEQQAPQQAPQQQSYWYYCAESGTYYPYVDRCAGPWQRVLPRPPS